MADRPIYVPVYEGALLVATQSVEFQWHPGLAPSQRRKSVAALHQAAIDAGICTRPLEISTKSPTAVGVELSAFNLTCATTKLEREFTVETAYQSSKVFTDGGPFKDLLYGSSLAAKKDPRLRGSGALVGFEFFGTRWSLEPRTAFYDWVYLNSLRKNAWAVERLEDFDAFTDIEFNPKKSFNCQAYSVALFKALEGRNLLKDALSSKEAFLEIVGNRPISNSSENTVHQARLV